MVNATYSDGRIEDVTHWTKFHGSDESVATVDETGRVKIVGRGESSISVWFGSLVGRMIVTSPYETKLDPAIFARRLAIIRSTTIISPSWPPSRFLRRVTLLIACFSLRDPGRDRQLPTTEQVDAFLKDQRPDRRTGLVDRLLLSSEFIDYWAYKWSDLLPVSSRKLACAVDVVFLSIRARQRGPQRPLGRVRPFDCDRAWQQLSNGAVNFLRCTGIPLTLPKAQARHFSVSRRRCPCATIIPSRNGHRISIIVLRSVCANQIEACEVPAMRNWSA